MNVSAILTRLVVAGATGMVGGYAMGCGLDHPPVTAIRWRKLGISYLKLKKVRHPDFADRSALADALSGQHTTDWLSRRREAPVDGSAGAALPTLLGAATGGLTSMLATWLTHRTQARAQWLEQDALRRQNLYKEFIGAAARCYVHAL
jgi:hypothetical protein